MDEQEEQKHRTTLIHELMERFNGDRQLVAEELGLRMGQVSEIINGSAALRARWGFSPVVAPTQADTLSREPLTVEDERIAAAIDRENKKLRVGLEQTGMSPVQIAMATGLVVLSRGNFQGTMDLSIAGATRTGILLVMEIDRITIRLNQVRSALIAKGTIIDEDRMFLVQEEKSLNDQFVAGMSQQIKLLDRVVEANVKLALVNQRLKSDPQKKAKPGFQPVGTQVDIAP